MPKGKHSLGVGIALGDPGNVVFATLTAPTGQTYSCNSNVLRRERQRVLGGAIQDYVDNPTAGRWVLSLEIENPVSGTVTSSPFRATVRYNSVSAGRPSSQPASIPS